MRKYIYVEAFIQWLKFFKTMKIKNFVVNFLLPAIIIFIFYTSQKDRIIEVESFSSFYLGVVTISTLIIGFSYSMIVSLITSNGENTTRLKAEKLDNRNITMFEGMLYKFYFVIINLILIMIWTVLVLIVDFSGVISLLVIIFIVINSLFVLIEGLTNLVSVFRK